MIPETPSYIAPVIDFDYSGAIPASVEARLRADAEAWIDATGEQAAAPLIFGAWDDWFARAQACDYHYPYTYVDGRADVGPDHPARSLRAEQKWIDMLRGRLVDRIADHIVQQSWWSGCDDSQPASPHFHRDARPGKAEGKIMSSDPAWVYLGGMPNSNNTSLRWARRDSFPAWLRSHLDHGETVNGAETLAYCFVVASIRSYIASSVVAV